MTFKKAKREEKLRQELLAVSALLKQGLNKSDIARQLNKSITWVTAKMSLLSKGGY